MSPTTNTEAGAVAAVAAKLTKGEAKVMRGGSGPFDYRQIHGRIRLSLFRKGLIALRGWAGPVGKQFPLADFTDDGLAVRSHLSEQGATAGVAEINEQMFGQGDG